MFCVELTFDILTVPESTCSLFVLIMSMEMNLHLDLEIEGETASFFNDDLLMEFAHDQGLTVEWTIKVTEKGQCAHISLNEADMPSVEAADAQTALDKASVQAIERLTPGERAREPMLTFA